MKYLGFDAHQRRNQSTYLVLTEHCYAMREDILIHVYVLVLIILRNV